MAHSRRETWPGSGALGHLSCTPEAEGGWWWGRQGSPLSQAPEQLQVHLFYMLSFS